MRHQTFNELDKYIPVEIVGDLHPNGPGLAIAVIDYSPEFDLLWVVIMDDRTKGCQAVNNKFVRFSRNISMERA